MNDKFNDQNIFLRAKFPGKIVMINSDDEMAGAMEFLRDEPFIGFDTETKPAFKKGEVYQVSLLQLATANHALLFRLHGLSDFSLLKEFFENANVKKIGVAIRDDIKGLQKTFHFEPKGFVELSEMAKILNMKNFGLKGMTEEALKLTLSKRAKLSNWESKDLSKDQLIYAATDAWI
ncbi:MAG: 3'-5' exonuclease, partial [Bacteriovorax sp.]|nr:3'-5' exonuclease [Bacteriovorax sp.]